MSSLQWLVNLLQWNSINESIKTISICMRSIFYIFAINIKEDESITSKQRYESKWHEKMKNNNQRESVTQSIQFVFFAIFCRRQYVNILSIDFSFYSLQSIRTRRLIKIRKIQIRKVWNNTRSRNRYRFVVFVFVLLEKSIVSAY